MKVACHIWHATKTNRNCERRFCAWFLCKKQLNLFDIFYRNFSSWMIEFSIIFYAACYCSTFYIVFTAFFKTKRCFVRQIIVCRKGLKQLLNPVISQIIKISVDNTWLSWISDGHSLRCPNSGRLKFRRTLTSTLIILDITKKLI